MLSNRYSMGVRGGLALGLAEIVYGVFFRLVGFHFTSLWGWIFYLMLPVAIGWALLAARRASGSLTVRRGLVLGLQTTALGSAIYCVQVWLYNRFVDDSLLVSVREFQLAALANRGLEAATLESAIAQLEFFLRPATFAVAVWVRLMLYSAGFAVALALLLRRASAPAPASAPVDR